MAKLRPLLLALGTLIALLGPSTEAATTTLASAYWWQGSGGGPNVPAGGLYVASTAAGPAAVSAVRLQVSQASPDVRLVLREHTRQVLDTMTLVLLPSTTSWSPGGPQPWEAHPAWDQQLAPIVGVESGSTVSFDLGSMTAGERRDLVLLPVRAHSVQPGFAPDAPAQDFAISFEPLTLTDVVAARGSVRVVAPTRRPWKDDVPAGPAVLHEAAPSAPELENRPGSGWQAAPLLVSGAQAYRAGEYLYQGFLFDDHGGAGVADPANDAFLQKFLFAAKAGTLTYPTDPVFANNAADIVEVRVRPLPGATAFRVTFASLIDPRRTAFTLALGTSTTNRSWPAMAGVSSPAQVFVTVHGSMSDTSGVRVFADKVRHQYDVRVPHSVWNPGRTVQRVAIGSGLWDVEGNHYLVPGAVASVSAPGGVSPSREALFDLGFRFHETMPDWTRMGLAYSLADGAVVEQADQKCFWRECDQAAALRTGDVSPFHADIDFSKLARRANDSNGVPTYGYLDRIHATRLSFGQGVNPGGACGRFPVTCRGMLIGNLQPYQVYVPKQRAPRHGWALTVMLHASGANQNERMGSRMEPQLATRDGGSIVMTALARDPDGDYTDATEAEVFEAWADVARHYPLNVSRTVIMGYSMGGGGTYKLAQRWPDLWAAGFGAAAVPFDDGWQGQWFPGMRNVPIMTWIGNEDEGSGNNVQLIEVELMEQYGFRFRLDQFPTSDHLTIATNDQYDQAVAWLQGRRLVSDPARISYVVDNRSDYAREGDVANHAYWLSGLTVRTGPSAAVDARSSGLAQGDPTVVGRSTSAGLLTGGQHGPMPYVETKQDWGPLNSDVGADRLDLWARDLATATVDLARANLTCNATVTVHTDGPIKLAFPACGIVVAVQAGTTALRLT